MVTINYTKKLGERMEKIETDIEYLKKSNDDIKVDLRNINSDLKKELKIFSDDMKKSLLTFTESADKKYASKLTERIVFGIVGAIGLMLVGLLIKVMFKYGGGL